MRKGLGREPLPEHAALDADRRSCVPPHHVALGWPPRLGGLTLGDDHGLDWLGRRPGLAVLLDEERVHGHLERLRQREQGRDGRLGLSALDLADQARRDADHPGQLRDLQVAILSVGGHPLADAIGGRLPLALALALRFGRRAVGLRTGCRGDFGHGNGLIPTNETGDEVSNATRFDPDVPTCRA
jgi:hypothetical protein